MELTKDAKKAIALIYREYQRRRHSGLRKQDANYFSRSELMSLDPSGDLLDNCCELRRAGLISSDITGGATLEDPGIVLMENKTLDTLKEWISFGTQFIP